MTIKCSLRVRNDLGGGKLALDETGAAFRGDSCPVCKRALHVRGAGKRIASRDTYEADGFCASCGAPLGTIVAQVSTIFGLEEDERVLAGPWKVY